VHCPDYPNVNLAKAKYTTSQDPPIFCGVLAYSWPAQEIAGGKARPALSEGLWHMCEARPPGEPNLSQLLSSMSTCVPNSDLLR
jgi:hypothetical protein